jgi:hypothetical protein
MELAVDAVIALPPIAALHLHIRSIVYVVLVVNDIHTTHVTESLDVDSNEPAGNLVRVHFIIETLILANASFLPSVVLIGGPACRVGGSPGLDVQLAALSHQAAIETVPRVQLKEHLLLFTFQALLETALFFFASSLTDATNSILHELATPTSLDDFTTVMILKHL